MSIGRLEIFTDEKFIDSSNVIKVLQKAMPYHLINARQCDFLLRYEAGEQPLTRKKVTRKEIDVTCIDNVANEISTFHIGYKWGIPITIIQRGERDKGNKNEIDSISLLNECYEAQSIRKKTQELARFVEICGIGYSYVDINSEWDDESDSYFTLDILNPETTFVIKSSYVGHKPMLGVSYREDEYGNRYFTCFTKTQRFEISGELKITNGKVEKDKHGDSVINWFERQRSGEINPLGRIPIIEWIRDFDRMGCFERQIDDMNALNIIESDICNATENAVNSIWHCNDVEFPKEIIELPDGKQKEVTIPPKNNQWLQTFTTVEGKTPFVTPLAANFDYEGNLNYAIAKRALILQKANVPSRGSASGGNTGLALDVASGANSTEAVASAQQNITEGCKMEEVKVVLSAIQHSPYIESDNPMLDLKYKDVQVSIKRNKQYELSTKSNALCTLISHGINPYHAMRVVNMFDDTNQVYADSEETLKMYQMSVFGQQKTNGAVGGDGEKKPNADRVMQDESDQESQSPNLSGKATA